MKVPAGGGTPEPVTTLNKDRFEIAHRWPHFLPDGRHFLYYVVSTTNPGSSEHSGIYVGSLDSNESRTSVEIRIPRALRSWASICTASEPTSWLTPSTRPICSSRAIPPRWRPTFPAAPFHGAARSSEPRRPTLIVHMRGAGAAKTMLSWRDRSGQLLSTVGEPAGYWEQALSHDGTRIAVSVGQDVGDIWIYDLDHDMRTRFTFDAPTTGYPIWSPDDSQVAFSSSRSAEGEIYVRPTSGQGDAKLMFTANAQIALTDWSSDGRLIFFEHLNPGDGESDIWTSRRANVRRRRPCCREERISRTPASLPTASGWHSPHSRPERRKSMCRPSLRLRDAGWFPAMPGSSLATNPEWRSDGRELFYLRGSASPGCSGDGNCDILFRCAADLVQQEFSVLECWFRRK